PSLLLYLLSFPTRRSSDLAGDQFPSRFFISGTNGKTAANGVRDNCDDGEKTSHWCSLTSFSDIRWVLTIFHLPSASNFRVRRRSDRKSTRLNSSHDQISYA